MRSARVAIVTVALVLVSLPFALLLVAWLYEQAIAAEYQRELERVADAAAAAPISDWPAIGRREGAWLRRRNGDGTVDDSGTAAVAVRDSAVGGTVERLLSVVGADTPFEALPAEDEPGVRASESGQTLVITVAKPLPGGATLVAERGSHRGIRQLLLARRQLAKLVLYQLAFALAAGLLLSRWLVKPLERLTARALEYPAQELAEPELQARRDEVGQLSRAFTALARSLEARRQETVDLAADIAHELKNPLAAISAASELIATTVDASAEKRAQVHGVILESVGRLERTTDALLQLVRLESALVTAERDTLDYGPWLDALLDTYRTDPQHAGWTFELDVPARCTAHVSAEAWASMLRNLLDNARVQPPTRQPRIRVRAHLDADRLVTDVTDFGPGVSEGNRAKVFDRFFTARPPGVDRGTGLGLAIVKAVAEAHGGTAELLPRVQGEGATFRVAIPLPQRIPEPSSPRPT